MEYADTCLASLDRLNRPVLQLKGVGPKTQAAFHNLGLFTLRDLIWNFPRSFIDRAKVSRSVHDVDDGEVGTFRLRVPDDKVPRNSVGCTDEAGNAVVVTFFYGLSKQGK